MSASMKRTCRRSAKNMRQLASKISDLQSKYQQQAQRRQEDIVRLLSWVDLTPLDDSVLMGAFLFIQNKITNKDPILEDWNNIGARFLRQSKSTTLASFTPNAAPQTTHRSSQKQAKLGDE